MKLEIRILKFVYMLILKQDQLDEAVALLKKGQVIIFPTETSYGLGCDATNPKAVERIFKIKERELNKALLVVVPNVDMAKKYLAWNNLMDKLAGKYWPGPLTVVASYIGAILKVGLGKIPNEYFLAPGVISSEDNLAIRVSAHPVLKFLSEKLGRPVVATSANISATGNSYDSQEVIRIFAERTHQPDAILDLGLLPITPPTTIVSATRGTLQILRQGEVKVEI